jgi:hypothetical protein
VKLAASILILLLLGSGCHSLTTGRQQTISAAEEKKLLAAAVPPEAAGVVILERKDRTIVRWREMTSPETPVPLPLLAVKSAHSVQPVVATRINAGKTVPMVVDTGSPVTLIDIHTALNNNLQVVQPERMRNSFRGLGGLEQTYFGMARQMTVGQSLAFRNVLMAIRAAKYERRLAGLFSVASWEGNAIGMSTLGNFAYFTLDYPGRAATFSYREYFPGPTNPVVASVPFQLAEAQVRVPLQLGGRDLQAMLDTGNDAALMINSNLVKELGWQSLADRGKKELYVGLGGDLVLRSFSLPALKLGEVTFTNILAVSGPEEFGVVLGSGFLHRYRATLDFRRKMLWLEAPTKELRRNASAQE